MLFGAQLVHDGWQRAGWGGGTFVRYGSLMGGGLDGFFPTVRAASGMVACATLVISMSTWWLKSQAFLRMTCR